MAVRIDGGGDERSALQSVPAVVKPVPPLS
jgi:hypothetical protein